MIGTRHIWPFALLSFGVSCSDVKDPHTHDHHEQELITTVNLLFTPEGGDSIEFVWDDTEQDGAPKIDTIVLDASVQYDLTVAFVNGLEEPAEDISAEIADEGEEHQIFFTGDALVGPANSENPDAIVSHAYDDADENGLPIGLNNIISALSSGTGELALTLRHLPPENDSAIKVSGLAEVVDESGFSAIGGANDAFVTFPISVN